MCFCARRCERWGRCSLTFVYEDETEVVASGEFLVDFTEGRRQVEAAKEEADGNGFACSREGSVSMRAFHKERR